MMRMLYPLAVLAFLSAGLPVARPAMAGQGCEAAPAPVITLDFGSRYKADSKTRSDLDPESDAAIDKALKPVDNFIQQLVRNANLVRRFPARHGHLATCVLAAIDHWAQADALSDLVTPNAKMAVPARIGGIAVAYDQVRATEGLDPAAKARVEAWLVRRSTATMMFFDDEAPRGVSRNNLRAWAGFAVGRVGLVTSHREMIAWAMKTNRLIIGQADAKGSLPLEMRRQKYALHYQLHAVGPLVTSIAQLCDAGQGDGMTDFAALRRIVAFTLDGVADPRRVELLTGSVQTIKAGYRANRNAIAWLEPYVAVSGDPRAKAVAAEVRPLLNSKLGGNLTALYQGRTVSCEPLSR